jgi:hypothetical protein
MIYSQLGRGDSDMLETQKSINSDTFSILLMIGWEYYMQEEYARRLKTDIASF